MPLSVPPPCEAAGGGGATFKGPVGVWLLAGPAWLLLVLVLPGKQQSFLPTVASCFLRVDRSSFIHLLIKLWVSAPQVQEEAWSLCFCNVNDFCFQLVVNPAQLFFLFSAFCRFGCAFPAQLSFSSGESEESPTPVQELERHQAEDESRPRIAALTQRSCCYFCGIILDMKVESNINLSCMPLKSERSLLFSHSANLHKIKRL